MPEKPKRTTPKSAARHALAPRNDPAPIPAKPEGPTESQLKNVNPRSRLRTKYGQAIYSLAKTDKILSLTEFAAVRQISAKMEEDCWVSVSRSNVGKILKAELDAATAEKALQGKQLVNLELRKLDRREHAIAPNLLRLIDADKDRIREGQVLKNADAVEKYDRVLDRIGKRGDALLGLSKPAKVETVRPERMGVWPAICAILELDAAAFFPDAWV